MLKEAIARKGEQYDINLFSDESLRAKAIEQAGNGGRAFHPRDSSVGAMGPIGDDMRRFYGVDIHVDYPLGLHEKPSGGSAALKAQADMERLDARHKAKKLKQKTVEKVGGPSAEMQEALDGPMPIIDADEVALMQEAFVADNAVEFGQASITSGPSMNEQAVMQNNANLLQQIDPKNPLHVGLGVGGGGATIAGLAGLGYLAQEDQEKKDQEALLDQLSRV